MPELEAALVALAADELVAFPTETVWGLAAVAASERALLRLRSFKGRADTQPIAVMVPDLRAIEALGAELTEAARRLAAAYWPGPLTLVVRCAARFARGVAGQGGSVGFRCSSHPAARALAVAAFERGLGPLTATSLNRSGVAPAGTHAAAAALCADASGAPRLLGGDWPDAGGGAPSSVVDVSGPTPRVLREGAIAREKLLACAVGGAP